MRCAAQCMFMMILHSFGPAQLQLNDDLHVCKQHILNCLMAGGFMQHHAQLPV